VKIDHLRITKQFNKRLLELPSGKQARVKEALKKACDDIRDPQLRMHLLNADFAGTVSLSAGGDLRIHCRLVKEDGELVAILQSVGTHSQSYR
jgi:mRNA-degrading endonuclease RelE of RelBE toxin-antitoxin system